MQTITTKPNQTIPDIILKTAGTMEAGMQLMAANNKSISDIPLSGDSFIVPGELNTDNAVVQYFTQNRILIGTLNQ